MQKLIALQGYLVILIDERSRALIGQSYIGWDRLILVAWLVHVLAKFLEQFHLGVSLVQLLLKFVSVLHRGCGIDLHLHHAVALLVTFQLAFGVAQFGVNLLQAVVDKLLGAISYLVLILIGLTVVYLDQGVEVVYRALRVFIIQYQFCDGSSLGSLAHGEVLHILVGCHLWRYDDSLDALAIF